MRKLVALPGKAGMEIWSDDAMPKDEIWLVDRRTGKVLAKSKLPSEGPRLELEIPKADVQS